MEGQVLPPLSGSRIIFDPERLYALLESLLDALMHGSTLFPSGSVTLGDGAAIPGFCRDKIALYAKSFFIHFGDGRLGRRDALLGKWLQEVEGRGVLPFLQIGETFGELARGLPCATRPSLGV